ncbi:MAG: hypothetical protein WA705_03200 [Candidatus Ozemobacteraceae bacterium]
MTIKNHFRIMTEFFEREQFEYGLIGAFALYAYGYTRATRDVDFITRIENQPKIVCYLESLGFETLHRSEGFSNHLHSLEKMRIDLVYVAGETARTIFQATRKMLVFAELMLPVVSPEHLVILKLFAIHNDPSRKFKELGDIKEVFQRTAMDTEAMRKHFAKYGLEEFYDEITKDIDKQG